MSAIVLSESSLGKVDLVTLTIDGIEVKASKGEKLLWATLGTYPATQAEILSHL